MQPDYKNWVPDGIVMALSAGAGALGAGAAALAIMSEEKAAKGAAALCAGGAVICAMGAVWAVTAHNAFSREGPRRLSRRIVEGTAEFVTLPSGGVGLDVGCGSGALTIACAKRNPQGRMIGVDRWNGRLDGSSLALCERNAKAEGVTNAGFQVGSAVCLPFDDETFDAVTSNYAYRGVPGHNRQKLLLETLRVLKKGGTFAIHDIMTPSRYGDMRAFLSELRATGCAYVELIDTASGLFITKREAFRLGLAGSALLVGRK